MTDHDMSIRKHKQFSWENIENVRKDASNYIDNPDNIYDIRRDEQVLNTNPEINEDRNETLEWNVQDNPNVSD